MKTKSIPSFLFHISTFTGKFFKSMPVAPLLSSPDSLFIWQIWPLAPTRRSGRVDINYVTPSSPCHASHYPGQCDVWRWEGPGLTRSVDGVSTRRPHARSRSRYLYRVSPARTLVQSRRRCHQLRSKEMIYYVLWSFTLSDSNSNTTHYWDKAPPKNWHNMIQEPRTSAGHQEY